MNDKKMRSLATNDGHVFWGRDEYDIVSKMRRADFAGSHPNNRAYIDSVAARIGEMSPRIHSSFQNGRIHECDEIQFIELLINAGLLTEITEDFQCPRAHMFCNSMRPTCLGGDGSCWLKKQES